jgi:hypothetical protein
LPLEEFLFSVDRLPNDLKKKTSCFVSVVIEDKVRGVWSEKRMRVESIRA